MEGLRMMKGGMPAIACCMGLERPRPPGMPKDACWSFPDIFWNLLSEIFSCFRMALIVCKFHLIILEVFGWYTLFHL